MTLREPHLLVLLLWLAAWGGSLPAQNQKTITLQILDSRTARPLEASNFLVRINHQTTDHADWVRQPEGGAAKLTLPTGAQIVSIHATYDSAMLIYANCDSVHDGKEPQEHWYSVAEVLASGVTAPNGCGRKTKTPKPGEFIFFARKRNFSEQLREDYSAP
jgi:hypothetical protein